MRSGSPPKPSATILRAMSRPSFVSRARYTSPMPPAPRGSRISYEPSRVPGDRPIVGAIIRPTPKETGTPSPDPVNTQMTMLDRLRFDITSAVRGLVATPAPTITALVTLAVAIGINLAMLGLVQRALSGLPEHVADPSRLFTVGFEHDFGDRRLVMTTTSYATFTTLQADVPAIAGAAAWRRASTVAVVGDEQVQMDSMVVSGSYFDALGARARVGRTILPADDAEGAPVAVLSDALWTRTFYRDPAIVGR